MTLRPVSWITLVVIGANPGYDAPADLEFARHTAKAAFRLHAGCYADETAALSTWHIPQLTTSLRRGRICAPAMGPRASSNRSSDPSTVPGPTHQIIALLAGQDRCIGI